MAYGAIACYLDRAVESRVAKYTYGTDVMWPHDDSDIRHLNRGYKVCDITGSKQVPGGYMVILQKVCTQPSAFLFVA